MPMNYSKKQQRPWFLRRNWVCARCIVLLPIGAFNVFIHRNYWQREERQEYIGVIAILIFICIWRLSAESLLLPFMVLTFTCLFSFGFLLFINKVVCFLN